MNISLKLRKSAGVPVSRKAHRLLQKGNAARDAQAWDTAVGAYEEALTLEPGLAHIWVQLGHCLKELGHSARAEAAYEKAAELRPASAEPHLHLGHLHKIRRNTTAAARSYLRAVELNPNEADAVSELQRMADPRLGAETDDVVSAIRELGPSLRASTGKPRRPVLREVSGSAEAPAAAGTAVVFDVSDLISYFRNARLPTGIQRVQIEVISNALRRDDGAQIMVCAFAEHRDEWLEIPGEFYLELAALSLAGGDKSAPDWVAAMTKLHLHLSVGEPLEFPEGASLVNLGTSWWLQNYFLFVRQAKARRHIHYVPFVHDLIPIMAPEHCTRDLTRDFISWASGAFDHADFFLVNSEATKRDLLKVAETLERPVDPDKVAVVRLDADFSKPDARPAPPQTLNKWGLHRSPFVLFVSTIESRKNHLAAFEAWIELMRRHGAHNTPRLVCVGNRGWLNDAVYAQLEANDTLRERVVMLSDLSDRELALLYDSCLFTLYPSRYEGWGLPVTESLCHGKVPLVSDASSLPEAGGEFAVYFETGSVPSLTERLEQLVYDAAFRKRREEKIAAEFRPRAWAAIAAQIATQLASWSDAPGAPTRRPPARLGAYHPLSRNAATSIWPAMTSTEAFRVGSGWCGPEDWGCWTKPGGAELEIDVGQSRSPLRLQLLLEGVPGADSGYEIRVEGLPGLVEGSIGPREQKWVGLTLETAPEHGVLHVSVEGKEIVDMRDWTDDHDRRTISIGVRGFFICRADDAAARADFLEALVLGTLDELSVTREPRRQAPELAYEVAV